MSNFVDNNTSLPAAKSNLTGIPAGANPVNYVQASDVNTIEGAVYDLRTVTLRKVSLMSFGADPSGATDCSAAFSAAFTALNNAGVLLLPGISAAPAVYKITANVTVPVGVTLQFDNATINISGAVCLTVNGQVMAPPQQIFNCSASSPSFGSPQVIIYGAQDKVNVLWFGADPNAIVDSTKAIQNAVIAATTLPSLGTEVMAMVYFPPGYYVTSAAIAFQENCNVKGENSVIVGPLGSGTVNLFTGLGSTARIRGMTFYGGNNALMFACSGNTATAILDDCTFIKQEAACIYTDSNCANLTLTANCCQFYNLSITGATIVSSNSGVLNLINGSAIFSGTTVFYLANGGGLYLTGMNLDPTYVNSGEWIDAEGSADTQVVCRSCRFGGEAYRMICKWNVFQGTGWASTATSEIRDSCLIIDDCQLFSDGSGEDGLPLIHFYTLPMVLQLTNNQGADFASGLYFDAGIPNDQIQSIGSLTCAAGVVIDFKNQIDNTGNTEITDRLFSRMAQKQKLIVATDILEAFDTATASYGGSNGIATGVTVSNPSTDLFGLSGIKWLSTNSSNQVSRLFTTALADNGAGPYSVVIDVTSCDVPLFAGVFVGGWQRPVLIPAGASTISIPGFKTYADPSTWIAGHSYPTAGVRALSTNGSDIWQVVNPGTSYASGSGPLTASPGAIWIETGQALTWEWVGSLQVGILCTNIPNGAQVSFGRIRIVKNHHECPDQNTIVYGTGAPGSGNWFVGDICYNTAPAASGNIGWVCTTAGSPGTWKTFGTISS